MLWLFIVLVLLAAIVFIMNKQSVKTEQTNNTGYLNRRGRNIQECISSDDIQYRIDAASQELEKRVEKSRELVEAAKRQGYITVSTAWMDRFNQMVEVSNTLNQNLIYENQRRLQNDKFHRYTSLHYRSMLMGDLAHQDYLEAKKGRDQIGDLLVAIGKKQVKVSQAEKTNYYQIKDAFKESTSFLYERMKGINNHTAELRDKIGRECGERGAQWRRERMKGRS